MLQTYIMEKTNEFLKSIGHPASDFQPHGYTMLTDGKNVNIFLYPLNGYLNFGLIPIDRKYNITKDIKVNIQALNIGLEESFIKYQPHKTNSELMYWIPTEQLTVENITKVFNYLFNNVQNIFTQFEDK